MSRTNRDRDAAVQESIREAARKIAAAAPPLTPAQRDLLVRVWVRATSE